MTKDFLEGDQPLLFQVEGRIDEVNIRLLERKYGLAPVRRADGKIATPLRGKSVFSIEDPIVLPLDKLLATRKQRLPAEIKLQMKEYEFYQVQLACTFDPAEGCRFHDARFDISLQTVPTASNPTSPSSQEQAIAYDLSPLRSEEKRTDRKPCSFKPEITLPSMPNITLFSYERVRESVSNTRYVEAINLQGTRPGWKFERRPVQEISG